MDTTSQYPSLRLVSHPLVQHKLTILRDRETPTKIFKELVDEIAMFMAYEATADLALEDAPAATPLERARGKRVAGKKLTLVPILRAGLGMVEGIYRLVPGARVGHIGLYRDHDTLQPVDYYFKVPGDAGERDFFLLDPLLARGGPWCLSGHQDTLEPVDYYFKVPGDAGERDFFVLDPMLATGGSAAAAV